MGAQDELWTSKQMLARSAVLLTALTVHETITPADRAKIGSYASDNGLARTTRYFAVPRARARRLKFGSHFVMSSVWDSGTGTRNPPNLIPAKCVHGKSVKFYIYQLIFSAIQYNTIYLYIHGWAYIFMQVSYTFSNTEAHYKDSH